MQLDIKKICLYKRNTMQFTKAMFIGQLHDENINRN
jgi:hypothetical protein